MSSPATPETPDAHEKGGHEAPPAAQLPKAEFDRALFDLWREVHNLSPGAKISKEQRSRLKSLLGDKADTEALPNKPELHQINRVYHDMAMQRKGFYPYIYEKDPKKRVRTKLSVDRDNSGTPKNHELQTLVLDPDSKEAQALAWLYNTKGEPDKMSDIFDAVTKEEVHKISKIVKIQEALKKLVDDPHHKHLGEKLATLPTGDPPYALSAHAGELEKLQLKIHEARWAANQERTNKGKNSAAYDEKADKWSEELEKLEEGQHHLQDEIKGLNKSLKDVDTAFATDWTDTQVEDLSEDFSQKNFLAMPGLSTAAVDIGRQTGKTLDKWVSDKEAKTFEQELLRSYRTGGTGTLQAGLVLDRLIHKVFEGDLIGRSKEEKEVFYAEIKKALLSEQLISGDPAHPEYPEHPRDPGHADSGHADGGGHGTGGGHTEKPKEESTFVKIVKAPYRAARWMFLAPFRLTRWVITAPFRAVANTPKFYKFMTDRPAPRVTDPNSALGRFVDFWTVQDSKKGGGGHGHDTKHSNDYGGDHGTGHDAASETPVEGPFADKTTGGH